VGDRSSQRRLNFQGTLFVKSPLAAPQGQMHDVGISQPTIAAIIKSISVTFWI
jgi:hypothetical protein